MNEALINLISRRSVRRYSSRQIPDDAISCILEAAEYSPNAGNRQTTQIVVCLNKELNEKLGRINKETFIGRISSDYVVSNTQPSIADDSSIESAFYDAPVVITLFGPAGFLYAEADCWIMAHTITLAARSLGIGSCMIGRAEDTFRSRIGMELCAKWNIPAGYEAKVHITLGYPADMFPDPNPRRYPEIIFEE